MENLEIFTTIGYYGGMGLVALLALTSWVLFAMLFHLVADSKLRGLMSDDFYSNLEFFLFFKKLLKQYRHVEEKCECCNGTGFSEDALAILFKTHREDYEKRKKYRLAFWSTLSIFITFCVPVLCGYLLGKYF